MESDMSGDLFPLVVKTIDGSVAAVSRTNPKAVAKSVERNEVWYLHPETGRVLPWAGGGATYTSLEKRSGIDGSEPSWYEVVLAGAVPDTSEDVESAYKPRSDRSEVKGSADERLGTVLTHLMEVVAARRRDMPEGSYTTHLFQTGTEKIRKKAGEEAVELILARDRGELTYEAADLIYHMLVLFEGERIPFSDVMEELERRF